MPESTATESIDADDRKVFTTFRVYREIGGYRTFPTEAEANAYAARNHGRRIDKIETTILWVDE